MDQRRGDPANLMRNELAGLRGHVSFWLFHIRKKRQGLGIPPFSAAPSDDVLVPWEFPWLLPNVSESPSKELTRML